jgi:Fe(3+) dicitrate transport protein
MRFRIHIALAGFLLMAASLGAQVTVSGKVDHKSNLKGISGVEMLLDPLGEVTQTDREGRFSFSGIMPGTYQLKASSTRFMDVKQVIQVRDQDVEVDFTIDSLVYSLGPVEINDVGSSAAWMRSVDGMAIYASKKTELIRIDDLTANLATNNARQTFSRVPGLNIWESDGGGLQLGIGGRGLNPNRTSNFNTRQNGYDIAADALGYPESYYTPPTEALERIEVVRGAASLQYGTQFGGVLNFVFREGPREKPFEFLSRQTVGSFGLFSSFNSVGGTVGKVNYYGFYQYKRGNGWRDNAGFNQHTAYGAINTALSSKVNIGVEVTTMHYLAQQPGGLTDAMFDRDPRQSIRDRNWFKVGWNLAAVTADFRLGDRTMLNVRNFGLLASRKALGFLGGINRTDPGTERDLIAGDFRNFGNETRLLHKYIAFKRPAALLVGARYYQGNTLSQQGLASSSDGPSFHLLNPENPERSDYVFPSRNISAFAEHLFNLNSRISFTPGLRYEFIKTASEGSYSERNYDLAGNLIFEQTIEDNRNMDRHLLLAGLGASYRFKNNIEWYGNFSQNYRAINFNDLRIVNPNFRVDENLQDERGYNLDMGLRGSVSDWLAFDMSVFFLRYRDRIGQVLQTDSTTFQYYRYRTNIADSRNIGFELYGEADLWKLIAGAKTKTRLALFTNLAWIDARYVDSDEPAFDGKFVEMAPPINLKTGVNFRWKKLSATWQWAWTAQHFTDATNAEITPNAVEGIIPAYDVMDLSAAYEWKRFKFEAGCNNLLNRAYFTRRAVGYPGPGIIPSDGRSFYFTLQVKI